MIKLALLIPTILSRASLLENLLSEINRQKAEFDPLDEVAVLTLLDNARNRTGTKRNALMEEAKKINAEYIAFIDDDDMIMPTYIQRGLETVASKADCGELFGEVHIDGYLCDTFHHSIIYKKWERIGENFCRMPNHLNFKKRILAAKAPFPDITIGEDRYQAELMRDMGLFKSEYKIKEPLYRYNMRG